MGYIIKRYSEDFKAKVIDDIDSGKFPSIAAAARHYGINKTETILKWLRREGRQDLLPQIVYVDLEVTG